MAEFARLTVVLASTGSEAALGALRALEIGCAGVPTEVILVTDAPWTTPHPAGLRVRLLPCPASALTPVRWGLGARESTGSVVAFTTDHMRVGIGWARALVEEVAAGAVGAGGPIALDANAEPRTAAAYLVRFSAFLPGAHRTRRAVDDIAGDNAAYDGEAVRRQTDLLAAGFWEVEFHRRFAAEGRHLVLVPGAIATAVGSVSTAALARQRFAHAREFGATRVRDHGDAAWRIVLAAPLVPLVLLVRIRRRASADRDAAARFPFAFPRLALLAAGWAAGEAVGAVMAARRRLRRAR